MAGVGRYQGSNILGRLATGFGLQLEIPDRILSMASRFASSMLSMGMPAPSTVSGMDANRAAAMMSSTVPYVTARELFRRWSPPIITDAMINAFVVASTDVALWTFIEPLQEFGYSV